jgi:molybdopterin biosynthesis enzyme
MVDHVAQGPQQIGTLTALEAARDWVLSALTVPQARVCSLSQAQGMVSAAHILAPHELPATDRALRDGWALSSMSIAGASAYSPVALMQAPAAVCISEPIPLDCDCVVEPSSIEWAGSMAQAVAEALPGEGLRRKGEDAKGGDLLIEQGQMIGPLQQLVLQAAGLLEINIRQPRILLLNSGTADTTTQMLARLVMERGGLPLMDHREGALAGLISKYAADLVLIIGGTGSGENDHSVHWLRAQGELFCHGLALEPGRTTALGRMSSCPVIVVPGLPTQALGLWFGLLACVHDQLTGFKTPRTTGALAAKIASRVGVAEVALLHQQGAQFVPLAIGDMPLLHLSRATHLLLIEARSEGYGAGETIEPVALRHIADE